MVSPSSIARSGGGGGQNEAKRLNEGEGVSPSHSREIFEFFCIKVALFAHLLALLEVGYVYV